MGDWRDRANEWPKRSTTRSSPPRSVQIAISKAIPPGRRLPLEDAKTPVSDSWAKYGPKTPQQASAIIVLSNSFRYYRPPSGARARARCAERSGAAQLG
eukprot:6213171-Pleurochrysis_carterae.AAC.1